MLRLKGCALLFSYVRSPRLPMLEERPPEEPPARASAMAGAKAMLTQKSSPRMTRQFKNRLTIAPLAQNRKSSMPGGYRMRRGLGKHHQAECRGRSAG